LLPRRLRRRIADVLKLNERFVVLLFLLNKVLPVRESYQ
jgi:hypothetical protein